MRDAQKKPGQGMQIVAYGDDGRHGDWLARARQSSPEAAWETTRTQDPLVALRERLDSGADILLIAAGVHLPPFWLERMLRALAQNPAAAVVSSLGDSEALFPLLLPVSDDWQQTDATTIDSSVWLHSAHMTYAAKDWSPQFSCWRVPALKWLAANPAWEGGALPDEMQATVCADLYVGNGAGELIDRAWTATSASPLDFLRAQIRPQPAALWAGLGSKPVILHILHGWGGGAQRFVHDLAENDEIHDHLVLTAHGDSESRCHGRYLALRLARDAAPIIDRWTLSPAVDSTETSHVQYRTIFESLIKRFCIDAIVVSSLIGHSLEALRTSLPLFVACHDYYPLWPVLHCDFDDANRRFDESAAVEVEAEAGRFFHERSAQSWHRLRQDYIEALKAGNATMIAPTAHVRANFARHWPALADLRWRVIPHGIKPLPPLRQDPIPTREKPRVLVLGRIQGGKGERLLTQLVPMLAGECDFYLLGCGHAGFRFFGQSHVHVELNYERDDLPRLLARIQPDLALLPVTVSETFSYTLSELWSLGTPPLATRLGSLAERIAHGQTGWLVEPDATDIAQTLRALFADRARLDTARAQIAKLAPRSLRQMQDDYATLLALPAHQAPRYQYGAFSPEQARDNHAMRENMQLRHAQTRAAELAKNQDAELLLRAEWGTRLEREKTELARHQKRLAEERAQSDAALAGAQARLDAQEREIYDLTQAHHLFERHAEALGAQADQAQEEIQRMLASKSWRLTKPLRAATRIIGHARISLGFQLSRIAGLVHRTVRSVKTRGFAATLRHIRHRLAQAPTVAPQEQEPLPTIFAPFALPISNAPEVSIIIPAFNHFAHTHQCLRSIAQRKAGATFETIVVDDCSSDETATNLPLIEGLRVVTHTENRGFIEACNSGAEAAKGRYLVFLNNDTTVSDDWLCALLDTYAQHPQAGLVGAKLVYPNGQLQEAGGIVFDDGSGWNYGRGDDPNKPEYNYLREADYCSGAAIMIHAELFARLGKFDLRYRPAYYEDTDLAFRVREQGLKVYYQPRATVTHYEGISSGTDIATGIKRHQTINQKTFAQRWQRELARQPRPGTPIAVAREHGVARRLLIVDACTPMPDQDSGSVRMYNMMRLLSSMGWKIVFFAENLAHHGKYTEALQQLGVEVLYRPWIADPIAWLRDHGHLLDAVLLSRHYVAVPFLKPVREYARHAKLIFDTVDLHFLREERAAALENRQDLLKAAQATKKQELHAIRGSDATFVVSPVERRILGDLLPHANIAVLSNIHDPAPSPAGFEARKDFYFVGGFQHPPNVDAMRWFIAEVWPLLAARLEGVKFHIIGSRLPAEIQALADARIVVHGFVEDLQPFLDGCRFSIAPLRYGAGVKGKINMSMAHGQPVVATSVAVEGMHLQDGQDVLVADDAPAFAEAMARLYRERDLWERLAANGRMNIQRHFSSAAAREVLERVFPAA